MEQPESPFSEILPPPVPSFSYLPRNAVDDILASLGPRDLASAAGVCTAWRAAAALCPWNEFYAARWPVSPSLAARISNVPPSFPLPAAASTPAAPTSAWYAAYCARMSLARSLRGRPQSDRLSGHLSGVKVARILPESNLLLTGSVDRRLVLWDLESGMQLAASPQHAGTVRCLAVDSQTLATGSSDHRIRVWRPSLELEAVEGGARAAELPFRVEGPRAVLSGHTGPVSALELAPTALFSGSWDYCIRVWDRTGDRDESNAEAQWPAFRCIQVLHFDDWVHSMTLRCGKLLVASGTEAHVCDAEAGGGLRHLYSVRRQSATLAPVTAVQGTEDGRTLLYSTGEGGIYACDLRAPPLAAQQPPPLLLQPASGGGEFSCSSAVTGLSWDFPWLCASLQNGEVVLLNVEASMAGYGAAQQQTKAAGKIGAQNSQRAWQARALTPGVPGGAQCVHSVGQWVVAGYESGSVATWDFSRAGESERAAEALRSGRRRERERRREAAKAQRARGSGGGGGSSSFLRPDSGSAGGGGRAANEIGGGAAAQQAQQGAWSHNATVTVPNLVPCGEEREEGGAPLSTSSAPRAALPPRVPAPIQLGRSPGAGEEGNRGRETWQVLVRRSGSSSSVGQQAGGGSGSGSDAPPSGN